MNSWKVVAFMVICVLYFDTVHSNITDKIKEVDELVANIVKLREETNRIVSGKYRKDLLSIWRTINKGFQSTKRKTKKALIRKLQGNRKTWISTFKETINVTLNMQCIANFSDEIKTYINEKKNDYDAAFNNIVNKKDQMEEIMKWLTDSLEVLENSPDADVQDLETQLYLITRQLQSQQFNEEEKLRSDGFSGIKQIRTRFVGEKNYHSSRHTGWSFASIHDHANNERLCGMGEFIGALNGVEFRTRHNDYALRQPALNDKTFNRVRDIEFPDVPQAVKNKTTVKEQIEEMREWFKAWANQDTSLRNYTKFFKPVLCYLEGSWTKSKGDVDEPFASSRHSIDAKSWFELQDKIQFTSNTGTKSRLENLAHLPTTIMGFTPKNKPIFAQWNYRILCHPLSVDVPTRYLKLIPDPTSQKMRRWTEEQYAKSRSARFDINGIRTNGRRSENKQRYTFLDTLMEEIPGKDNYGAHLPAEGFDSILVSANPNKPGDLNGAYYHRAFKLRSKDAMGVLFAQKSFSDRLFVAMTSQEKVAGPKFNDSQGKTYQAKASYAVPMEVIYLTPLQKWNPYNLQHIKKRSNSMPGKGTEQSPFNGTDRTHFYRTPVEFFIGSAEDGDSADTTNANGVWVKDKSGVARHVQASGVRVMFPKIKGIDGDVRQRYPIMPIHGEGSALWKKVNAFEDSINVDARPTSKVVYLSTGESQPTEGSQQQATKHTHYIEMDNEDYKYLLANRGQKLTVSSSTANTHFHELDIYADNEGKFKIETCDGKTPSQVGLSDHVCFDNHPILLTVS